jgi:hypothetical protein
MATATKQPPLVVDLEARPAKAELMPAAPPSDVMTVIERVASNPDADIAKLERLIELKRTIDADHARAEFYAAFAEMQGEIPEITEKGEIKVDGQVRSRFAKNEDIQKIVRPILQKHGFALSFRNQWLQDGKMLKVIGILSHRSGHSEQDEFVAAADTSGSKNAIQALGSTRSYGQRYTTIALLNIATREDDDGEKSEQYKKPESPDGFDAWTAGLDCVAEDGIAQLTDAFNRSKDEHKKHLLKHFPKEWAALKNKAQKAKA